MNLEEMKEELNNFSFDNRHLKILSEFTKNTHEVLIDECFKVFDKDINKAIMFNILMVRKCLAFSIFSIMKYHKGEDRDFGLNEIKKMLQVLPDELIKSFGSEGDSNEF